MCAQKKKSLNSWHIAFILQGQINIKKVDFPKQQDTGVFHKGDKQDYITANASHGALMCD